MFVNWRRTLAKLEEEEKLVMTPFEKNLEVWRQLWRVLERSDIVVQVSVCVCVWVSVCMCVCSCVLPVLLDFAHLTSDCNCSSQFSLHQLKQLRPWLASCAGASMYLEKYLGQTSFTTLSVELFGWCMSRVGQNYMYTVEIRYLWQGNHQIYGHIRCIHTVLTNPMQEL